MSATSGQSKAEATAEGAPASAGTVIAGFENRRLRFLDKSGEAVAPLPDFIANAGGVICAAVEYAGGTETQAYQTIDEKIRANTAEVLGEAAKTGVPPRQAAEALAERRVRAAMSYRRWG